MEFFMKCNWCGSDFNGSSLAKFCSNSCRQRSHYGSKNRNPPHKKRLLYGVGVNDIGGTANCPFYQRWSNMLQRCYDESFHKRKPNYIGHTVCSDWLVLSKFKAWMERQDWEGMHLDKDLRSKGGTVYDPEVCLFITPNLNKFLSKGGSKGGLHCGVTKRKSGYFCFYSNQVTKEKRYIGPFNTESEAVNQWKIGKRKAAVNLYMNGTIRTTIEYKLVIEYFS